MGGKRTLADRESLMIFDHSAARPLVERESLEMVCVHTGSGAGSVLGHCDGLAMYHMSAVAAAISPDMSSICGVGIPWIDCTAALISAAATCAMAPATSAMAAPLSAMNACAPANASSHCFSIGERSAPLDEPVQTCSDPSLHWMSTSALPSPLKSPTPSICSERSSGCEAIAELSAKLPSACPSQSVIVPSLAPPQDVLFALSFSSRAAGRLRRFPSQRLRQRASPRSSLPSCET